MKSKDVYTKYGFDPSSFEHFVKENYNFKAGFLGIDIPDSEVESVASSYKDMLAAKEEMKKQKEAERLAAEAEEQREEIEKQRALSSMLITSGFSFDGYKITKYSGYISGDDCIMMPRDNFFGTNKVADNLCGNLVKIRRQAIKELKEAAYDLGCNAVIGVDFDYMTMDPQHSAALNAQITVYEPYVICVTANGNAVVIEKDNE